MMWCRQVTEIANYFCLKTHRPFPGNTTFFPTASLRLLVSHRAFGSQALFPAILSCIEECRRVLSKNSDDTRLSLRQQMDWPSADVTEMMVR
jgi:hypothetical protein